MTRSMDVAVVPDDRAPDDRAPADPTTEQADDASPGVKTPDHSKEQA